MGDAFFRVPEPYNEPIRSYKPGSPEREAVVRALSQMQSGEVEVPLIIGEEEIRTGNTGDIRPPHNHGLKLGTFQRAGKGEVNRAVEAALQAKEGWAALPWHQRVSIFLKAADLLTGPWRPTIAAATMIGQSKTVHQAEIEAVCELSDFWRFNPFYLSQIYSDQPHSVPGTWNRCEYRPLEGFVFAVTPFNFTAIAGNLPTAPAMAGNVVLWKPASSAILSAYYVMRLLQEAGLPPGVINFIPGSGAEVGDPALDSPELAGIHFTGSTDTFRAMWTRVGRNINHMKRFPRIVGETGGKGFIFAHSSADLDPLVTAAIRGAFEYQGQKCSAATRMYLPASLWPEFRARYLVQVDRITVGPPDDFGNFMTAVIDRAAFEKITGYIEYVKGSPDGEIISGGGYDDSVGYFVEPTTVLTTNPHFKTMVEEIFGPVLTLYVYEDGAFEQALNLCDRTSPYGLTGAVWARDREALNTMSRVLQNAAGNFYINDKPTAAVVGQQPFGGNRASGTNDKAGSIWNLQRWMTVRSIKETTVPPGDWAYPFMEGR